MNGPEEVPVINRKNLRKAYWTELQEKAEVVIEMVLEEVEHETPDPSDEYVRDLLASIIEEAARTIKNVS